ncbi:MAG: hypothetical protein U9N59_01700 [Campylobacterota bacterium]|nr:hypothetical protein [Campylobacterota bacterium]
MLSLTIEDKNIENIYLKEFHSDKKKFFSFIQSSFEKLKNKESLEDNDSELMHLQISSMTTTWNNDKDKGWDDL